MHSRFVANEPPTISRCAASVLQRAIRNDANGCAKLQIDLTEFNRTAGIDVGGTKIATTLFSPGSFQQAIVDPTPQAAAELVDLIARRIEGLGGVDAVGIGLPSVVNLADGSVASTVNIPSLDGLALKSELEARLGVPVFVDNDANLAAVSEAFDDHGNLVLRSVVCLTLGTGLGGGAVIDGRLIRGSRTSAFEFGQIIAAADLTNGAPLGGRAPLPEALETWASGTVLSRLAIDAGFEGGPQLVEAAEQGSPDAIAITSLIGERVGVGIANAILLFEPEAVVLAGGLSRAGDLILKPATAAARRLVAVPGLGESTRISIASHADSAGVRGAAILPLIPA